MDNNLPDDQPDDQQISHPSSPEGTSYSETSRTEPVEHESAPESVQSIAAPPAPQPLQDDDTVVDDVAVTDDSDQLNVVDKRTHHEKLTTLADVGDKLTHEADEKEQEFIEQVEEEHSGV